MENTSLELNFKNIFGFEINKISRVYKYKIICYNLINQWKESW